MLFLIVSLGLGRTVHAMEQAVVDDRDVMIGAFTLDVWRHMIPFTLEQEKRAKVYSEIRKLRLVCRKFNELLHDRNLLQILMQNADQDDILQNLLVDAVFGRLAVQYPETPPQTNWTFMEQATRDQWKYEARDDLSVKLGKKYINQYLAAALSARFVSARDAKFIELLRTQSGQEGYLWAYGGLFKCLTSEDFNNETLAQNLPLLSSSLMFWVLSSRASPLGQQTQFWERFLPAAFQRHGKELAPVLEDIRLLTGGASLTRELTYENVTQYLLEGGLMSASGGVGVCDRTQFFKVIASCDLAQDHEELLHAVFDGNDAAVKELFRAKQYHTIPPVLVDLMLLIALTNHQVDIARTVMATHCIKIRTTAMLLASTPLLQAILLEAIRGLPCDLCKELGVYFYKSLDPLSLEACEEQYMGLIFFILFSTSKETEIEAGSAIFDSFLTLKFVVSRGSTTELFRALFKDDVDKLIVERNAIENEMIKKMITEFCILLTPAYNAYKVLRALNNNQESREMVRMLRREVLSFAQLTGNKDEVEKIVGRGLFGLI